MRRGAPIASAPNSEVMKATRRGELVGVGVERARSARWSGGRRSPARPSPPARRRRGSRRSWVRPSRSTPGRRSGANRSSTCDVEVGDLLAQHGERQRGAERCEELVGPRVGRDHDPAALGTSHRPRRSSTSPSAASEGIDRRRGDELRAVVGGRAVGAARWPVPRARCRPPPGTGRATSSATAELRPAPTDLGPVEPLVRRRPRRVSESR